MSQFNPSTSPAGAGASTGGSVKRNAVLITGGAALVAIGLAAGLAFRPASTSSSSEPAAPVAAVAVPATPSPATTVSPSPNNLAANDSMAPQPATQTAPPPVVQPVPSVKPAPAHRTTHVARAEQQSEAPAPQVSRQVAVCSDCGTIESVTPVKVKGSGSGVGAVGGGVIGGALANQLGHGNGKAALTVLGAIGGGLAGNEVEKHVRATTMYDVQVRMEDGSYRTLREQSTPQVGERVRVEGETLRARN